MYRINQRYCLTVCYLSRNTICYKLLGCKKNPYKSVKIMYINVYKFINIKNIIYKVVY